VLLLLCLLVLSVACCGFLSVKVIVNTRCWAVHKMSRGQIGNRLGRLYGFTALMQAVEQLRREEEYAKQGGGRAAAAAGGGTQVRACRVIAVFATGAGRCAMCVRFCRSK
jgi:hypothetical protein